MGHEHKTVIANASGRNGSLGVAGTSLRGRLRSSVIEKRTRTPVEMVPALSKDANWVLPREVFQQYPAGRRPRG